MVTPVEYWNTLKPLGITNKDIDKIALAHNIQESNFEVLCLGQGTNANKTEKTFFVVVRSNKLLKVRKEIFRLIQRKSPGSKAFSPENFYPHITIGFTKRDLHESDGVIKDQRSCISNL